MPGSRRSASARWAMWPGRDGRCYLSATTWQAIQNLCKRALTLEQGKLHYDGFSTDAVSKYVKSSKQMITEISWPHDRAPGNDNIRLLKAWIKKPANHGDGHVFTIKDDIEIGFEFNNQIPGENLIDVEIHLQDESNILLFMSSTDSKLTTRIGQGKISGHLSYSQETCKPGYIYH